MNTERLEFENSPMGQNYIIHLQDEDEISLHALEILRTGLITCFLPIQYNSEQRRISVDISGCVPISKASGKAKSYIGRHYRQLITAFISEVIQSLDYALCFNGICFSEDQLYFDKRHQRLVCIYLPLRSKLVGHEPLLSAFDENAWDELLFYPYEKKWITTIRTDRLYELFRNNDEDSSLQYLKKEFWNKYEPFSNSLKAGIIAWIFSSVFYLFISTTGDTASSSGIFQMPSKILFLFSTVILLIALLSVNKKKNKKETLIQSQKEERRKKRNTTILFPNESRLRKQELLLSELSPNPVQFLSLNKSEDKKEMEQAFTIWTDHFVVGLDSDCCDFSIDDPSLSLTHALFVQDCQGLCIEDLHSQNGTFVNRKRLMQDERVYLQDGDILGLGSLEFVTRFI